jgi:glucose-1-phosphate thymidylyltransferase
MGEKAAFLAGGLGERLKPMTNVTNKHLLDVYDVPMIYGPIRSALMAGIDPHIRIVMGGPMFDQLPRVLEDENDFRLPPGCPMPVFTYSYQKKGQMGIGAAIKSSKDHFNPGCPVIVILSDNDVDHRDLRAGLREFRLRGGTGCHLFLTKASNPRALGVAKFDRKKKLTGIIEKPKGRLPSRYSVAGIYFYDDEVWEFIERLTPSDRGELEVTDLNNAYIERGEATYTIMRYPWVDAGEPYGKLLAANRKLKGLDSKLYRQLLRELGEGDIKKSKKRR